MTSGNGKKQTVGSGAKWKNGLAWLVIGGLKSSMLLTLIIVPVIYHLADLANDKVNARISSGRICK